MKDLGIENYKAKNITYFTCSGCGMKKESVNSVIWYETEEYCEECIAEINNFVDI